MMTMDGQGTHQRGQRHIDHLPLADIQGAPRNAKRHNGAGLAASLGKFGVGEPPLLDERTGRLVAGHGRIDQLRRMQQAGQTPPDGVTLDADGAWLVPVTRGWASRSDLEAEAYLVASNQLTTAGGWDDAELADMLADLDAADLLDLTGFTDADLAGLLGTTGGTVPPALTDPDQVPEPPAAPVSVLGDLWLLGGPGAHRVLCGDATNPDDLKRLVGDATPGIVYTDPPYGIKAVPKDGGASRGGRMGGKNGKGEKVAAKAYAQIVGDDTTDTARDAFALLHSAYPDARHVWWGGNHYAISAGLPNASCWLVWDKENHGNDFADAELAWTNHPGAVRLLRHMWNGMLRASERGKQVRVHPTQKPVALAEWAFSIVDPKTERRVVLDVFGGSGSTLIAAHATGRAALIAELEPAYVDVMVKRWVEFTGDIPRRQLADGTTEAVDFATTARS